MTVFTRIDHGAAAEKAGLELRPTVVVVFGNPRAGTPAMQATPTIAIDLPLRMLIWQDEKGDLARLQRAGMDIPAPRHRR